jgi:NAD(P)-dependent dehydrogenase (short-subunit alcohol dehydrogenase family)
MAQRSDRSEDSPAPRYERVAIVTGAGRGIGAAIARALSEAGMATVVADLNADAARTTASGIQEAKGRAMAYAADVSNAMQVTELIDATMSTFGRLDVLVNNACHSRYAFLTDLTEDEWNHTLDVCLKSCFLCTRAAVPHMIGMGGGRIVNISSMAARVGLVRTTAYAAAKGGLEAMTRALAVELAPHKVLVNCVAPGPIDTDLSRQNLDETARRERLAHLPIGEFGRPVDVARAVVFLAEEGSWITGATLAVDGGFAIS